MTINGQELILSTYPLVQQYGCSFYDARYLTLALDLKLPRITADRKGYQPIKQLPDVAS